MMKRSIYFLLFGFLLLTSFTQCKTQVPKDKTNTNTSMNTTNSDKDFADEWRVIDSLEGQGLPKSALEKVEALYAKAKGANASAQVVKCLIYQGKYQVQLEEDGLMKVMARTQDQIKEEDFPVNAILQSMLAEMYSRYLDNNYWKLANRTETPNFQTTDISTWTPGQLNKASQALYWASIENQALKTISITDVNDITGGVLKTDRLRPSLYDFLAHRAIDYFMNERSYLSQPAYQFTIQQAEALGSADAFIQLPLESKDSTSSKYNTLLLMKELLAFHQKDADPSALVDVDLKRIQFVYNNSSLEGKKTLYENALTALTQKYAEHESVTEVMAKMAQLYMETENGQPRDPKQQEAGGYQKAFDLCQKAIQQFPESYGASHCQLILDQILRKDLNVTTELVNVPDQAFRALIHYRNVPKVYLRLVALSLDDRERMQQMNYNDLKNFVRNFEPLKSWSLDLPNTADYRPHSTEVKIDQLPAGMYMIVASDNALFNYEKGALAHLTTFVSNIAYWHRRNADGSLDYFLTNRQSGQPLTGAKASFYIQKYNDRKRQNKWQKIGDKTSDQDGFINSGAIQGRSFYVRFEYNGDVLYLDNRFSNYANSDNARSQRYTHFFTDRAIYRPGQTVYFKGLLLENDKKGMPSILPNTEAIITFRDVNRQEVNQLRLRSNEYGTVSGSFIAPTTGLLGYMSIESNLNGRHGFRVEEYKRPKFEVSFDQVETAYRLGDMVTVKGKATAFAGSSIDGAKVAFRVQRTARYPYLPWSYRRWGYPTQSNSMEILNGVLSTDAAGRFEITFEAKPDRSISKEQRPEFTYEVSADVTDITGETRSNSTNVRVGYIAMQLDFSIPSRLHRDSLKELTLKTRNLNGAFEAATGTIKVEQLKSSERVLRSRSWSMPDQFILSESEFVAAFPNDIYKDEDKRENWPAQQTIWSKNFNTAEAATLKLAAGDWPIGSYKVTVNSQDKYGEAVEVIRYVTIYDLARPEVPAKLLDFFVSEKSSYEPGETATFTLGSAATPLYALYEIEHKNKIVKREWIAIDNLKSIQLPIEEKHRGNIHYSLSFVKYNRSFIHQQTISVPWSNKDLQISYETFRDKLAPGQKEEWRLKISGPKKEKVTAEMVAAMYDASLDEFAANEWMLNLYPSSYRRFALATNNFNSIQSRLFANNWQRQSNGRYRNYRQLNWFGFDFYGRRRLMKMRQRNAESVEAEAAGVMSPKLDMAADEAMAFSDEAMEEVSVTSDGNQAAPPTPTDTDKKTEPAPIKVRTNLNETVFFYPDLRTDKEGNIIIRFTMNEALTKWKFLGLAHTKDLKIGLTKNEVVTQKELMVVPNPPRFFREGDAIEYTAKVSNLTDALMSGTAQLELFDAISMQPVDQLLGNTKKSIAFDAKAGQSARLSWKLKIPTGKVMAITHRVTARAGQYADGEESSLPVLTNRMLVTESMPLPVRGGQEKTFNFKRMAALSGSNTLQHHQLTLEFTSNPAWYAVQSLPYLMEYPYNCTEQIFNRYYANALASSVANAHPKIKKVFNAWKGTDAMKSNLSKNQELKSALLEETPWVLSAQREEQQKQNIGLLFDLNRMSNEKEQTIARLAERQQRDGGFSWFPGGRSSWYITQYLVEGMGHLDQLGVAAIRAGSVEQTMLKKAIVFIDEAIVNQYERLQETVKRNKGSMEDDHLDNMAIHYLYTRSFFKDLQLNKKTSKAHQYYLGQAEKYWLNKGMYSEGMIALALHRYDRKGSTGRMIASFKERALQKEEMGMYWKYDRGYYWYQLPIETHALMIEVFDEVAQDAKAVEELKVWLLKVKQTTNWKTTKATAAAVYALLRRGDNWLLEDQPIQIQLGDQAQKYAARLQAAQSSAEAGTGYFKTAWKGEEIGMDMAKVAVKNPNKVVAWGGLYWQYFEQLDKITTFEETPLQLKKQLFKEVPSDRGPVMTLVEENSPLEAGDKLKVRIELRVDRPMEYVHMKDSRASGLEPINVLSSYKWQGGLGYYESTKDASTNFFFSYLPQGTYVFEYPLRVIHNGDFSNGITTIQSMYAPEFSSHSEGVRIRVGQ